MVAKWLFSAQITGVNLWVQFDAYGYNTPRGGLSLDNAAPTYTVIYYCPQTSPMPAASPTLGLVSLAGTPACVP